MTKWRYMTDEIYSASSDIVSIDKKDIHDLKKKVMQCPNQRIRICAHQASDDRLHEMLIVITQSSYIRPHKHQHKSESFHLIEGLLDVLIFNDQGDIIELIEMGDVLSGKKFFYRLSSSYFHTLVLRTDLVVFHETTNGPFVKEHTVYAPWAPDQSDHDAKKVFDDDIARKINIYVEHMSRDSSLHSG